MRFWWVNQNQTAAQEVGGGYLWSPVRNRGGGRNPFYEFMREVAPGDIVFSFYGRQIRNLGVAKSYCYESPKPEEFGTRGANWSQWGHRIDISYLPVPRPFTPKTHFELIAPLLPHKYSPLHRSSGSGLQNLYLTTVSESLATVLLALAGIDQDAVRQLRGHVLAYADDFDGTVVSGQVEERIVNCIRDATDLSATEKARQIDARIGQGRFRMDVLAIEPRCRVTLVSDPAYLIASHIKPWRACERGEERTDPDNGLALTPHIDHLFDRGFISFTNEGEKLLSPLLSSDVVQAFQLRPEEPVAPFIGGKAQYLDFHRRSILRRAM